MEPDPGPSREPEARLAELANALVDGLVAALPGWVEKCVSRVADAWSGDPVGDTVEVLLPEGIAKRVVRVMENGEGKPITVAPGDPHRVWIDLPEDTVGAFVARVETNDGERPL